MKIGLLDVDGKNFPNLALMKISAYHKNKKDHVEWYDNFSGLSEEYDIVYMSKVFSDLYTNDYIYPIYSKEVIKGGYGYDNYELPFKGYETMFPDYSIYHEIYPKYKKTAFGYLTRGCPRNCDFCMVSDYEGTKNYQVSKLSDFYDPKIHKEIKLLDPNLFANKDHLKLLNDLAETGATIDVTQGFDIRLLNRKQADIINKFKVKVIHFAWDNMDGITEKILEDKRSWFKFDYRKLRVYVLINFNTTDEEDLYRVNRLRELGYDPYVMVYDRPKSVQVKRYLQRWVNNKIIWHTCESFERYLREFRHK